MTDPINMLLWCPQCNAQHIDAPSEGWDNPPHRSHLCHECGCIWRPADVPTNGVAEVKTAGDADTWGWIGGYSLLPPLGRRLSDALASLEIAERDRHDLLHALGWKTGPFTDDGTRQVVMDDTAGLRPEMVKARRRAQEAEGSAMMWHMIAGDRVEDAQSGLLLRIWRQLRDEQQARRLAEGRLAKAQASFQPHPDTERIDALRDACWDLRCFSVPTGGGDGDVAWRVVGHWMAEPHERTIAEGWSDDPRVAIDAALSNAEQQEVCDENL